jgi:hypothetical protein
MTENKPTGTPVRDMKGTSVPGTTEKKPAPAGKKQVQIHAGNLGVVQTQLLSEINQSLTTIAACCKIWLKENPPSGEK